LIILLCLWIFIPLAIKQHKLNKITTNISQIEKQIEFNKSQRLSCETNMKLWNKENESNRVIINDLKQQYNEMVGFTSA
jgi:hypothetical protein